MHEDEAAFALAGILLMLGSECKCIGLQRGRIPVKGSLYRNIIAQFL